MPKPTKQRRQPKEGSLSLQGECRGEGGGVEKSPSPQPSPWEREPEPQAPRMTGSWVQVGMRRRAYFFPGAGVRGTVPEARYTLPMNPPNAVDFRYMPKPTKQRRQPKEGSLSLQGEGGVRGGGVEKSPSRRGKVSDLLGTFGPVDVTEINNFSKCHPCRDRHIQLGVHPMMGFQISYPFIINTLG